MWPTFPALTNRNDRPFQDHECLLPLGQCDQGSELCLWYRYMGGYLLFVCCYVWLGVWSAVQGVLPYVCK